MLTLFKSLVLPRLDYGSQLWSPHFVKHIDKLEKIQRSFNKHITGMQSLEYSEWLVYLKLYSLQRRRERYCIIYVWKIIEGLVPNFSKPIVCSYSERRGRSCIISHVNLGRLGFAGRGALSPKYQKRLYYFSILTIIINHSLQTSAPPPPNQRELPTLLYMINHVCWMKFKHVNTIHSRHKHIYGRISRKWCHLTKNSNLFWYPRYYFLII